MIPELDQASYPVWQVQFDQGESDGNKVVITVTDGGVSDAAVLAMITALAAHGDIANVTAYKAVEATTSVYPA